MSEFRTIRELCSVVVDCPHSTPKWTTSGKIVVRNNNIKHGRIDLSSPSYTDEEHFAQRIKRAKPQPGDIIITREAPIGDVGMIPESTECCLGQRMVLLRADQSVCDNFYLLYSLQSLYVQHQISWSEGTGTTVSNLRIPHLEQIQIPYLPIGQQMKISSVLRALEEKIENNRKLNDNLEQQADALYQSFFSPKSGTQGKLVTLDEYCSIFTGKKNANASVDSGKYKFFTCAPDALQIDSYIYDGNAIIVSGNGAYTGRTRFYSGKFDLYQRTYACTLLDNVNPEFIFPLYWFVKLELSKKIMGGTRGSAIPYIVMNDLAKFEFIYNEQTFTEYMPIFKSLTEAIQANEFENENLAQIRDSLLPKLMSGELDVSGIDL